MLTKIEEVQSLILMKFNKHELFLLCVMTIINLNADQCASMAKAIEAIFPHSLHKFYRWHILRKHKEHL
jgi:hypothetical protein